MKLSIVVPVYKSENILPRLVNQIQTSIEAQGLMNDFELILVNDCSPDRSWEVIQELASRASFIRGVALRKNFGQHSATMAGLNFARGEVVVVMDDDLQHHPREITKLIAALDGGADVCYTRYLHRKHALWKKLGSRFNDLVATVLLNKPRGLYLSSFKALKQELVQEVIKYDGPYAYVDGLILEATRSIAVVDVQHEARNIGEGNYNLRRSISLWLRMATSFSVFPLRVATFFGFLLSAASIIITFILVIQKLTDPSVIMGWTSLMAAILFVGGVQIFCIGLLGEYLGRTYLRVNGKPQFVVRATTWANEP